MEPSDPRYAALENLAAHSLEELKVALGAIFNLLLLVVSPLPPDDADAAIKTYESVIVQSIRDVARNAPRLVELLGNEHWRAMAEIAQDLLKALDSAVTTIFGGAASAVLAGYESGISGIDVTSEAGNQQVLQTLMGRAFELGMGAHLIAILPELAYFTKQLGLNATAALLAELAGFHEVMIAAHRPFMTAALARPSMTLQNRRFPTVTPAAQSVVEWHARRLLSEDNARSLLLDQGFGSGLHSLMLSDGFRPISPAILARIFQDQPFPRDDVRAALLDSGYRDQAVEMLLDGFEAMSIRSLVNGTVSDAMIAYGQGVVSDDELDATLAAAGWSDQAKKLVKERALFHRRLTLAHEVQTQVTGLVSVGLMDGDTALQQLEAAGIQDWQARLRVTLAETKAQLTAARREQAAERRAEIAATRNLTRAAVAEYQRGVINEDALTTALAALGLDPSLVASIVAVQSAMRYGKLKLVYGQLLSPPDAAVLKERVDAIGAQVKNQMLTMAAAATQLAALGIDPSNRNALIARWEAQVKRQYPAGQLVSPITGQAE